MANPEDYAVVSQIHTNQWNAQLQQVISGWEIQVRDAVTGTIVPVFVADSDYSTDAAQAVIEAALAPVREIAQLGKTAAPAQQ